MQQDVIIENEDIKLLGILAVHPDSKGLVIFAHGSGSGRLSPRNTFVAGELQKNNLGTLLMDLLTEEEEQDRSNVFDIELLANRLVLATQWYQQNFNSLTQKIAYFGASTGGGAALVAAAKEPQTIKAVVSRGGRPDLAGSYLSKVKAPTLLLVGGDDTVVIELNRDAYEKLNCEKKLKIIPGATHLFEEPGTLEEVTRSATQWFLKHL